MPHEGQLELGAADDGGVADAAGDALAGVSLAGAVALRIGRLGLRFLRRGFGVGVGVNVAVGVDDVLLGDACGAFWLHAGHEAHGGLLQPPPPPHDGQPPPSVADGSG